MRESDPVLLSSAANPTIRRLVRLRDNRRRRQARRVLVDGWRESARAIDAGLSLTAVYWSRSSEDRQARGVPETPENEARRAEVARVRRAAAHAHRYVVSDELMAKIAYGQSPRGVVAEFEQPDWSPSQWSLPPEPLILILDTIEKPGNVGAVLRCADAAGVDAVMLTGGGCDLFNPNVIRSSLGTVFTVPTATASDGDAEAFLLEHQIRPVAARVEGATPLWSTDWSGPVAVILGSEAYGLGSRWQALAGKPIAGVAIPMMGRADSLNISVSAAVIAYEARRTRLSERTA